MRSTPHGNTPPRCEAGLIFLNGPDYSRYRQSVQNHSCLFAPQLGEAAASRHFWIGYLKRLHLSPMVAVRDTIPRRSADYRAIVKQMISYRVRASVCCGDMRGKPPIVQDVCDAAFRPTDVVVHIRAPEMRVPYALN
jgi:hypothetical protein